MSKTTRRAPDEVIEVVVARIEHYYLQYKPFPAEGYGKSGPMADWHVLFDGNAMLALCAELTYRKAVDAQGLVRFTQR